MAGLTLGLVEIEFPILRYLEIEALRQSETGFYCGHENNNFSG